MKNYKIVPTNFQYPEIRPTDFRFGSKKVLDKILNPSGDWRDFLPPPEEQKRNGLESSSCFIQAQQHAIATILEKQYGLVDQNFSERFNLIFANATPDGGSPIDGADSIRHQGLIQDESLPFSPDLLTWGEFNSWRGGDRAACLVEGQRWLRQWGPKYEIVFLKDEPVEMKYNKARQALTYGTVPVSVYGWVDENGLYVKPAGVEDNHLVELVYIDQENHPYVFDTYGPDFIKKLAPFYNFDFGLRWTLTRKDPKDTRINWLLDLILRLFKLFSIKPRYA